MLLTMPVSMAFYCCQCGPHALVFRGPLERHTDLHNKYVLISAVHESLQTSTH